MTDPLSQVHWMAGAVLVVALFYGGYRDVRSFQIPNWVSGVILAAYFIAAIAVGWDATAILNDVSAALALLVVGFILFSFGLFGGGDAKMLAATVIWTGWSVLGSFLLVVALAGGCLAFAILIFRKIKLPTSCSDIDWIRQLHSEKNGIPYGVAIAASGIILFWRLPVIIAGGTGAAGAGGL